MSLLNVNYFLLLEAVATLFNNFIIIFIMSNCDDVTGHGYYFVLNAKWQIGQATEHCLSQEHDLVLTPE